MATLSSVQKVLFPLAAACALAACGQDKTEQTFTTDTTDKSGGELIVTEQDPNAVQVTTPDTAMTNVPPGETPSPTGTASPTGTPTATVSPSPSPTAQ
ncbi:hypothetical protein [Altererythrobacter sp. Root672]|uniref:hypothetical protein n=1 Tax=Altererythrobacter sp. Root672 TaxID=1736584 RepID=UPI0006FCB7A0|nr:hypothetical protein [Altererythrobacter sp. Root672]KRA80843.1 hypothetical protein ASD76_16340 [Altererythrobacter sp. Root672]